MSAAGEAVLEARAVTERHATTFAFACRLLPAEIRDDVYLLYQVFRTVDDLVDEHAPDARERLRALAAWASGDPGAVSPETEVLDALAARHPLPRDAVTDFCAGMERDLGGARFATERELDRYCYEVAGTVGVVMTAVLGSREPDSARASAAALGMAMQRTNILRDIDEDAAAGRVYISDEARRRHGGSLEPGARSELVREQIARADELYEDGLLGLSTLRQGRAAIAIAARLYREILREIERGGFGRLPGRAVVSRRRRVRTAMITAVSGR
jgi:phytoene synthase